jgi:hypothetical protein
MENIFLVGGIISVVYFLAKFIEMRFIASDAKPLKVLTRDTILVYISAAFGLFILGQFSAVQVGGKDLEAFTDTPGF